MLMIPWKTIDNPPREYTVLKNSKNQSLNEIIVK